MRTWTPQDHGHAPQVGDTRAAPTAGLKTGSPTQDPKIRASAVLWQMRCSSCHGPAGAGNGMGKPPGVQIPSFQSASWQKSQSDKQLVAVITQGKGLMPAFGKQLKQPDIEALVAHIRRLGTSQPPR